MRFSLDAETNDVTHRQLNKPMVSCGRVLRSCYARENECLVLLKAHEAPKLLGGKSYSIAIHLTNQFPDNGHTSN